MSELSERFIKREEIYKGAVLDVVKDTVELPDGKEAFREVCLHVGAVCVIPYLPDGRVIMERQYRYAHGRVFWEIPAGKLDKGETDELLAAARELREETGYTADNYTFIGYIYPSPAILSEKIAMYVATGLHKGEQELDENEFLDVVKVPFDEVVKMIMENKIPDAKTQTAVLKAKLLLGY